MQRQAVGWALLALICTSCVMPILALPHPGTALEPRSEAEARKYAEKPNASKKVVSGEAENHDLQTNSVQEGFSLTNLFMMVMQMLFPATPYNPTKSDSIDTDQGVTPSPWANLLAVGLKILTAFFGGGQPAHSDGIDKVDNSTPLQGILTAVFSALLGNKNPDQVATMAKQAGEFVNIVVNLLDALKTSFSHRSMSVRALGMRDSVSEAAVAGLTMLKGCMLALNTDNHICAERFLCEASSECSKELQGSTMLCKLGTVGASFVLQKTNGKPFQNFYEAARIGRSGEKCRVAYATCGEA
ncbi:uncharacterized protein LOC124154456 isoform X1 [Ischnura elegans]|uniref:uncharacterized protein LOC124154456 isoform X1 n=1 Tax=Ischnura elegans TaxID=197161 RepID=UPI001ED8ABE1|nr:uncharacterized protein LOC124154456 isoform X1 [Ischnura elegans]